MKKFWTLLKLNWQETIEYRADMVIWSLSWVVIPFVGLGIWLTVSSSTNLAYSRGDFTIYFLTVALVNTLTGAWGSWFINEQIIDGSFSKYLLKPLSLLENELGENISEKIFKIAAVLPFILAAGYFLHVNLSENLNLNVMKICLFLFSLISAFIISFLLDLIIGLTGIWFHDVDFLNTLSSLLEQLFKGILIPIIFLPGLLHELAIYLPFRYTVSFPVELLLGKISGSEIWFGLMIQLLWLLIFLALYKTVMKFGCKYYQGYGG